MPPKMLHQDKANFWLVISLVSVVTVLYFIPVSSIDADSRTYSNITANLARHPLKDLFAVKWYGDYKIYPASSVLAEYFYEHPPGLFFLPWIVAQLGFPGYNALFAVDIMFQMWCFIILINLGRRFLPSSYAHLIPLMLLFMPIAFQYNVRGNHESGILFYFLLSFLVVSGECNNTWHLLVLIFTFTSLGFLKGALALPCFLVVFITSMVSWRLRQGSFSCFITSKPCFFLIISLAFSVFFAILFELVHLNLSGNSFWTLNLNLQVLKRAAPPARSSVWLLRKVYNVGFYLLMVSWYSFPYSI